MRVAGAFQDWQGPIKSLDSRFVTDPRAPGPQLGDVARDVVLVLDVYGGLTRRGESHPSQSVRESHRLEMVECPVSCPARDAARPLPRLVPFPMTVPEDRQRHPASGSAVDARWLCGSRSSM